MVFATVGEHVVTWSTFASAVATWLLLAAAVVAGIFAYRQAKASEGQLKEAQSTRVDSLRPVLVVARASLHAPATGSSDRAVKLTIDNVGPGPAVDVEALGWVISSPNDIQPTDHIQWQTAIASAERHASNNAPNGKAKIVAIAGHQSAQLYLLTMENETYWSILAGRTFAFVLVSLRCRDVFDNEFKYPKASDATKMKYIRRQAVLSSQLVEVPD